tara:strand:- start:703 stop:1107 length:405 start_codon:yes stop_codon:yes gene_type:complete
MPFCGTNPCGPRSQKKFIHKYKVGSTYTAIHFTKGEITFTVEEIVPVSTSTLTGKIIEEGLLVNINGVSEIITPRYLSDVEKIRDGGGLKPRKGRKGKKGKKGKKNRNNKTKRKSRRKTKKKSTKKKQRTKRRN